MVADRENIMNAVSNLGFEVFRNGQFHWNSSSTPDMYINQDGSIHCWTSSPFKNNTSNHGDLIDFLQMINLNQSFKEAKDEAERLTGLTLPNLDTYKDNGYTIDNTNKKTGYIDEEFIKVFDVARRDNFERYKELLNEALPSLDFNKQKEIALKYQIGYIEMSDRLSMPIRDEENKIVTLWKYNKNPKSYINDKGVEVTPSKVLFTKGRDRCPFNLYDMQEFRKDLSKEVFLCGGEKDTLNMLGNGFRAVTLGAENENLKDKYKPLFQDLKIVIAYDNDKAGIDGANKILNQLQGVAKEVQIWNWNEIEKQQGIKLFKGFDMTDYLTEIKKLNLEFKMATYELAQDIKVQEQNENKLNKKDTKMAILELTGKNEALTVITNNSLQYKDKEGTFQPRGNLATSLDMIREAANVVGMNKGAVTFSTSVTNNQGEREFHKFFVNIDKDKGDIVLKPVADPKNEDMFITFNKVVSEDGKRYSFKLDDSNQASNFFKAFDVSKGTNDVKYLSASVYLKNDDIKEALQEKGKDYKAVLSSQGFELKTENELYKKASDDTAMNDIKKTVSGYGNYGAAAENTQAQEQAKTETTQQQQNRNTNRV